jgi:hypothetical protein
MDLLIPVPRGDIRPPRGDIGRFPAYNQPAMIYCVIPRELADELYDKMVDYYKDNPNVTVIVDRREGRDRRSGSITRSSGRSAIAAAPIPASTPTPRRLTSERVLPHPLAGGTELRHRESAVSRWLRAVFL